MASLLALLILEPGSLIAQSPKPPSDSGLPDLATYLDLAKHYVAPVLPKKDLKTGFLVGGKNDTSLLRKLTEINGRTIAELENDMRPGAKSDVGSRSGFLGAEEKLLDILAMDNTYVVEELGLTHQELAKHLNAMGSIAFWQSEKKADGPFRYRGRRFKVTLLLTAGSQPSPFRDGTRSGTNVKVENLDNGKALGYSLLVPHLIERYGFYEGKGTPYRVDPRAVLDVFDFLVLEKQGKKR